MTDVAFRQYFLLTTEKLASLGPLLRNAFGQRYEPILYYVINFFMGGYSNILIDAYPFVELYLAKTVSESLADQTA